MKSRLALASVALLVVTLCLHTDSALAKNPYRNAFFTRYPNATGTALDNLPSNATHCGVCHFNFDGGGTRNPYGLSLEVRLSGGMTIAAAIADAEGLDAENDGFSTLVEVTDTVNFSNTPTFPGLNAGNVGNVLNVSVADMTTGLGFLTPAGALDTTPPDVTVLYPIGGEALVPNATAPVAWTATDASGIAFVDLLLSDDGGASFKPLALGLPNTGAFDLFIPNLPGSGNFLRVTAYDLAANAGHGDSPAAFAIDPVTTGIVPTTLRDFELPGTQPFSGVVLDDPSTTCITCHGEYDPSVEPYHNWQGSMMAQAMRDPLYRATVVVAEQAVPAVGDLCLRCHTPGGWAEGRSTDTSMGMLQAKDYQGIQCDFCHRLVDPHYVAGVSPPSDEAILAALDAVPLEAANGQFVMDPDPFKRGPYSDVQASHQWLQSDFTLSADMCATCHDVSNPAFVAGTAPGIYEVQALDAPHPDGDKRNMFPVERTFSEWSASQYAAGGVYQPQFAGGRPDGMVSTCQDCHMRDVTGLGAAVAGTPTRTDLGLHDLTGGNHFMPDMLPDFYPGLDTAALQAGKQRAVSMLTLAATMELTVTPVDRQPAVSVRITNETGHKLPSGYPEGRRTWINVKAYDAGDALVYESAHYDPATGELTHDPDAKIYHVEPGISTRMAAITGMPVGPSFFFALNDSIFLDNRIPPRGFTNAAFTTVQSPPVGYVYPDGQYWDDTQYLLPATARRVDVTFYYQGTSKEYIEFLRDENTTNSLGQELHDSWAAHGRAAPVVMAQQSALLDVSGAPGRNVPAVTMLAQNYPNPFNPRTWIDFSLSASGPASLRIYDARGRVVRTLVDDGQLPAGAHHLVWDGCDDAGRSQAAGIYTYVLKTRQGDLRRKLTLIR